MKQFIQKKLTQLRRDEGGAIFLLILAAFLILFMVAMTLFDTGVAAGDKMAVQISADTAAYSHSVVKARSMNVIVYANIIKRIYYSYMSTYVNAWTAILANAAHAASRCRPWRPDACLEAIDTGILILLEGLEFGFTNGPTLGLWGKANFSEELLALDTYQRYMHAITPWWAYIESLARGAQNGALVSASWPPPPTSLDSIKSGISTAGNVVDSLFGTSIMNSLPGFTTNVDTLPLARRDKAGDVWSTKIAPFEFTVGGGGFIAGARYCKSYTLSYEHILHGFQTWKEGDEGFIETYKWKRKFIGTNAVPALGCIAAHLLYKDEGYLDWRIKDEFSEDTGTKDAWAQSTSNISLAYRPRKGRMDDSDGRSKYNYLSDDKYDYNKNPLYQNEGYFAMARSEIVYKQPFDILSNGSWGGPFSVISSRLGTQTAPDMWSPRWKAKGRPFLVPGETMGSSVQAGNAAGLNTIINDTVPLLVLASALGLLDDNFSGASAAKDLFYLVRIGSTFSSDKLNGVPK